MQPKRTISTTPLQARVSVAAGPHLLTVEKEGFTQVRKEVRVSADQVSDEFIRLVPSPDMAEAYEARATRMRAIAWTAAGSGSRVAATVRRSFCHFFYSSSYFRTGRAV